MLANCLLGGIVININGFLGYVFDEKLHFEIEMLKDFRINVQCFIVLNT